MQIESAVIESLKDIDRLLQDNDGSVSQLQISED